MAGPCFPLEPPHLPPILLESHFFTVVLKLATELVGQRIGAPKIRLLRQVGKAAQLRVGFSDSQI